MRSVMSASAHFARVPQANIQRSSFDRSHGYKTTLDAGTLCPIFVDEVLPGDTFSLKMQGFARLATPLKPIMDNAYFNTFFFFVPNRLLWDKWEEFNGQQASPAASTDYLIPQVVAPQGGWRVGGLSDYFGLPLNVTGLRTSALWHRAYNLIWNEWFRDENLQASRPVNTDNGPDSADDYTLLRRGKRHDYFTSCLPWPQKGETVTLPLGSSAPVVPVTSDSYPVFKFGVGNTPPDKAYTLGKGGTYGAYFFYNNVAENTLTNGITRWHQTGLEADLSDATASTINQLRQAFAIQRLHERDARGGTRYTEIVRSHFGVVSPDQRLQRPEYLGGGQSPVLISQVPQTSSPVSEDDTPQGNLAAFGVSSMSGHGFSKSFTEHGVIIGLVCVRADLTYQQGLDRMWSRRQRFDFFWPSLAHIGEQAVLSKEIWCDGSADDEDVFGYQERFAEYRYKNSKITGLLRSDLVTSLDVWHLSQDFAERPLLNGEFIKENPPFDRVVAVPSEPHFIADFFFSLRCARPMPVYGVPGMIDHF